MKELLTNANRIQGEIVIPGDKSISHRSIMFAAIAHGTSKITGFLHAEDCISTMNIFRSLGVQIDELEDGSVVVHGKGIEGLQAPNGALDAGNSGTTMRLLAGLFSGFPFKLKMIGDASLSKRPMNRVMIPLRQMGASISGSEGSEFAPLYIQPVDHLNAIEYDMPVASAQVKSSILLAGLSAKGTTIIHEKEKSRDHTERMLRQFGVNIEVNDKDISLEGGQTLTASDVQVPADISSAAFFIVAALLVKDSQLRMPNVGLNPTRAGIIQVLKDMGGLIETNYKATGLSADLTVRSSVLKGTEFGGDIIPTLIDEIPIIALAATQAEGQTIIRDAQELKVKETDRIQVTAQELNKMGANIIETEDGMIITGPTQLHAADVDSHGDHRIGMMLQIAALLVEEGTVHLTDAEAVNISFPSFFDDLARIVD
ncbi:3-phosphoshikimate 1-carboxyvinyltransferase [Aerococcus sp. 1KP-2016]|uniref:3-phosphoshikimate 1-carboxyvinyltransferase n=1 Tax=Aerococcus sp. 1KP-2016 TaxID=1981982 RepID=UPI000B9939DE|nr:3-phosphoshikimate 1-carboxyvinyltransferase [Aerococcus sp. 1KP-2016]OYQ67051.1 3-phosphoshikimate 1-carboxyvinyltransferase [Aerococcus sp. 1KP-2016]